MICQEDSLSLSLSHTNCVTWLINCFFCPSLSSFSSSTCPPPQDAPVCEWEGAKEVLALAEERVEMECRVRASPPDITFTWESVTFTPNMEQVSQEFRVT